VSVSKKELANYISQKLRLSMKDSLSLVSLFFSFISNNKKNISIQNFGTFMNKTTPKRIGRNPKTGEEYLIRPRIKKTFKPSEEIKKLIN
jgi:integration host factor subunit alpha